MMYDDGLRDIGELRLPPAPNADWRHFDVFQNYELQAEQRADLMDHLESRGVRTIIQWGGTPVHQFKELGFTVDLPHTDAFFERCLMLPMNTALSNDDVTFIVEAISDFYGS